MKSLNSKFVVLLAIAIQIFVSINAQNIAKGPIVQAAPGNALAFDGSNDVVNLGNGASVQLSQGTIEAWIKTSNAGSSWRGIVVKQMAYGMFLCDNELVAYEWNGRGNISSGVYLNDNKWHHVAFSFNAGVSNGTCLYVDGVKKATLTFGIYTQNVPLGIGNGSVTDNIQQFNGLIDEVRVWNVARTESEIKSTMYNELAGSESGLLGYYKFNQGVAGGDNTAITTVTDQTSNGLNGTLTNFSKTGTSSNFVESYAMVVPMTAAASDVYEAGFMANWTAPAFGTATSYKLDVSTSPVFSSFVSGYAGVDCGNTLSKKVLGLSAGTTYYYRVRADKSGNTGGVYYSPASVSTTTDTRDYGNGSWIGYVFTQSNVGDLFPSFTDAQLKGTITQDENFNVDWAGSGPTLSGTTYSDYFHVRYKMTKNYPRGRYSITIGGDDGVRLSKDGGLTYLATDWSIHGYRTAGTNLDLDGNTNFTLDFYEHGGGAHVSFNIVPVCVPAYTPKNVTVTNNLTNTTIAWDANGNNEGTVYQWQLFDSNWNYINGGDVTSPTVTLNNLSNSLTYKFRVWAVATCSSEVIESELFTPKYMILSTGKAGQTGSSIQCTGTITYAGSETITERGFCWSNSANPTINNQKIACGNGTGNYSGTATNLNTNDIYYLRAYATTAVGTVYGNEIVVVPGISIQTGVIHNAQNGSASSNVYVTKPDGVTVTEQGICWNTIPNPTVSDQKNTNPVINNLASGQTYYVRGYAIYNGVTIYGNEQIFKYDPYTGFYLNNSGDISYYSYWGDHGGMPFYKNDSGFAISYMWDSYWAWGLDDDTGEIWAEFASSNGSGTPPVTGWNDSNMQFTLVQTSEVSYNTTTLKELASDNGSINSTITITHNNANGNSFSGVNGEDFTANGKVVVCNLPTGLTATVTRTNALNVSLKISGSVSAHANINDLSDAIAVEFQNSAFTNTDNVLAKGNYKTLSIDFIETQDLTVSDTKDISTLSVTPFTNIVVASNSTLTVNNTATANRLTLNAGGTLNISNTLTVDDVILKADDAGSFSAKLSNCMTVNGTLTFEKTMLDSKWYFLSFPCDVNVSDITMNGGGTLDADYYILTYNGSNRATNGLGANWSHVTNGTLTAKKGYAFGLKSNAGTKTLSFVLNKTIAECESEATVPATFYDGSIGNNHKGWNLIGQPYLSKFAGSNVGINYLTTWNGSNYVGQTSNLVNSLNPFEAFFVQVPNSNPISFNLAGRQAAHSAVSQNMQESVQLNLSSASGTDFSTLIFDNSQSVDYEIGQDLEKWLSTGSEKPQIYSVLNGIKYAYNALPIDNAVNLPVGYYSKAGGASTISASNINVAGLSKLFLTDTQTGTITDLMTQAYSFNADAGTNNTRFTISPQRISTSVPENTVSGEPFAYIKNSTLIISNLTLLSTVRLYDAMGRLYVHKTVTEAGALEIPLQSAGMYVLKIDSNTGNHNFKLANN